MPVPIGAYGVYALLQREGAEVENGSEEEYRGVASPESSAESELDSSTEESESEQSEASSARETSMAIVRLCLFNLFYCLLNYK